MTFHTKRPFKARLFPSISSGETVILPVLCFLAAYAGPFGTYNNSFPYRLAFWTLVIFTSVLMAGWFTRLAHRLVSRKRPWLQDLFVVGLMTACFSPVLIGYSAGFLAVRFASLADALPFAQFVAIISLCITTSRRIIAGRLRGASSDPDAGEGESADTLSPEPVPEPRLMRRLPESFRGPILRLTVEDHFVDVVGPEQTHRLRMRFSDAIDEMDPITGFCTHRSHWVARAAVERVDRDGGRIFLVLTNGDQVPVSRTYRPQVEVAGLL